MLYGVLTATHNFHVRLPCCKNNTNLLTYLLTYLRRTVLQERSAVKLSTPWLFDL